VVPEVFEDTLQSFLPFTVQSSRRGTTLLGANQSLESSTLDIPESSLKLMTLV